MYFACIFVAGTKSHFRESHQQIWKKSNPVTVTQNIVFTTVDVKIYATSKLTINLVFKRERERS